MTSPLRLLGSLRPAIGAVRRGAIPLAIVALLLAAGDAATNMIGSGLAGAGSSMEAADWPEGTPAILSDGETTFVGIESEDGTVHEVRDGTVIVAGDFVGVLGPPEELTGPELVGYVIGTFLCAIPIALLVFVVRAFVLPGYFRAQRAALGGEKPRFAEFRWRHARPLVLPLLRYQLAAAVYLWGATALASVPGLLLLAAGGAWDSGVFASAGLLLFVVGASGVFLFVYLGLLMGERVVVFESVGARKAIRRSFRHAQRNRLALFVLVVVINLLMIVSLAGYFVLVVGLLVTLPLAKAVADTAVTHVYLAGNAASTSSAARSVR